jgi:hypothetical protein
MDKPTGVVQARETLVKRVAMEEDFDNAIRQNHPDVVKIPFDELTISPESIQPGDTLILGRFEGIDVEDCKCPAVLSAFVTEIAQHSDGRILIRCHAEYQSSAPSQLPKLFPWRSTLSIQFAGGRQSIALFAVTQDSAIPAGQAQSAPRAASPPMFINNSSIRPLCYRIRPEALGDVPGLSIQRARRMTECAVRMTRSGFSLIELNELNQAGIGHGDSVAFVRFSDDDLYELPLEEAFKPTGLLIGCVGNMPVAWVGESLMIAGSVRQSSQGEAGPMRHNAYVIITGTRVDSFIPAVATSSTTRSEPFNPPGNPHILCFVHKQERPTE